MNNKEEAGAKRASNAPESVGIEAVKPMAIAMASSSWRRDQEPCK